LPILPTPGARSPRCTSSQRAAPRSPRGDAAIDSGCPPCYLQGDVLGACQGGRVMRRDVTFVSQGLSCAGWLYVPDDLRRGERRPAIVMAHGFSAVKEMHLPNFAERFTA